MLSQVLSNIPLLVTLLPLLFAVNVVLASLYKLLDLVKDKTKTQVDDKVSMALHKASDFLQKVLDMLGYNPQH